MGLLRFTGSIRTGSRSTYCSLIISISDSVNSLAYLILQLIFQTTVRCLAFTELADDAAMVQRLKHLYDTLDTATTPATVLLPWLPGPSAVRRLIATKRLYDIISKTLDERVKNGIARDDTPQMLIDAGDERLIIIGVS